MFGGYLVANNNVLHIYPTEQWKVDVANKVNEIRRNREFRSYAEAMQQVFFSLVELNIGFLGIYAALIDDFISEAKKIA